jgi:hypothetical protein
MLQEYVQHDVPPAYLVEGEAGNGSLHAVFLELADGAAQDVAFVVAIGGPAAQDAALLFLEAESMLVDFTDRSLAIFTDSLISRTQTGAFRISGQIDLIVTR